jgi:hypothetical protein
MVGLMALTGCRRNPVQLLTSIQLSSFPSGSSIETYKDHLLVIGDDATQILVIDLQYNKVDSVLIDSSGVTRVAKSTKPDYEASAIIQNNGHDELVVFGSGSTANRENILTASLPVANHSNFTITHAPAFYDLLKQSLQLDLNIEGATIVKNTLVLANRAHVNQPQNSLVQFSVDVLHGDSTQQPRITRIQLPATGKVVGVSGLAYEATHDMLWFTASTEETSDTQADGAIGDSYVGYIENATTALQSGDVKPTSFINLSEVDSAFKGHKIEAIAIEHISNNEALLHLVADNDDGTTQLFKLSHPLNNGR